MQHVDDIITSGANGIYSLDDPKTLSATDAWVNCTTEPINIQTWTQ